MQFESRFTSY